jgi:aldehyde dehydrogenase (NAD+)
MIANWLVRLFAEARLPDGVVQVITGRNAEISDALLASPDAVTFTGSNEVGGYLRRTLADRNVRLQGELGGKNVSVVLADADLDMAAATVASAAFAQAGQRCTATSRLIVEASVASALTERLRDRVAEIVVGPGLDPATTMGPLSYAAHRDGVLEHIERARKEGGEVILGGGQPASDALSHGCYVEPTVVNVTPAQSLWRDEVFGPVLAITTATGFDDAVRLANDTAFGLAAAVFTTDLTSSARFLEEAEAGQVAVNLPTAGWDVHHPFGGFHESGSPFKEQGAPGLRFYTRIKTTAVRYQW